MAGESIRGFFALPQLPPLDVLITPLINDLNGFNERMVIILDDYHLICNRYIHDIVQLILDNRPPLLHFVLITREEPPLTLAWMRTGKAIFEVSRNELCFSEYEVAVFVSETMKLNLEKEAIALINMMTDGWIAGLQLAALLMRGRTTDEINDFLVDLSCKHRYIIDYLVAEVLANLPEEVRDFLYKTAALDYLCASLCNTVTGREDSQQLLDLLEHKNLFLFPLDNQRQWYRYHHLFIDLFRAGLSREEQQGILQKTAGWYEANGYHEEAAALRFTTADCQGRCLNESANNLDETSFTGLKAPLSNRELELLQMVAAGLSTEEIAGEMVISLNTTKWHLKNIFYKLRVNSRIQAIIRAKELELL